LLDAHPVPNATPRSRDSYRRPLWRRPPRRQGRAPTRCV
jgi:hypothetical protein